MGLLLPGGRDVKILVMHGPNLGRLGEREPDVYGTVTLKEIDKRLKAVGRELKVEVESFQSDHEGELVGKINSAEGDYDAIIINAAAYTHTSVAIRDALAGCKLPAVEVHLSNIYGREEFRHHSLIAPVVTGMVAGFGPLSYELALRAVVAMAKGGK